MFLFQMHFESQNVLNMFLFLLASSLIFNNVLIQISNEIDHTIVLVAQNYHLSISRSFIISIKYKSCNHAHTRKVSDYNL